MDRSTTSSVNLAKDIWNYTQLRAARQAAITIRRAGAKRRSAVALGLILALAICVVLSLFSVIGAVWIGLPSAGLALLCAWGIYVSSRGRAQDAQMREQIHALEKKLAASSAGRRALRGTRRPLSRSGQKWVAVAQAANRKAGSSSNSLVYDQKISDSKNYETKTNLADENASLKEKSLLRADEQAEKETVSGSGLLTKDKTVEENLHGTAKNESADQKNHTDQADKADKAGKSDANTSRAWMPIPVPAPTYTLLADAPAKTLAGFSADRSQADSVTDQKADSDQYSARVPLRPKNARVLPAGEALTSAQLAEPAIDLEEILNRRRAAGA